MKLRELIIYNQRLWRSENQERRRVAAELDGVVARLLQLELEALHREAALLQKLYAGCGPPADTPSVTPR